MNEGVPMGSRTDSPAPMRPSANESAAETYPCIRCGQIVETGRARLAAVTCHDCNGRESDRGERRVDTTVADSPASGSLDHELDVELYRGRRYRRPVVLASISRLDLNGHGAALRAELTARLRAIDRVWEIDDRLFLLLPETDKAAAKQLLERISEEKPALLARGQITLAAFPDDALTSAAMLAAAKQDAIVGEESARRPGS
jgi:DNA-directed RNA polymerase subunit RPC12/RpoP